MILKYLLTREKLIQVQNMFSIKTDPELTPHAYSLGITYSQENIIFLLDVDYMYMICIMHIVSLF